MCLGLKICEKNRNRFKKVIHVFYEHKLINKYFNESYDITHTVDMFMKEAILLQDITVISPFDILIRKACCLDTKRLAYFS